MGYNKDNYRRIREEFANKYKNARELADRRREEVWVAVPEVRTLDAELGRVGLEIMGAISAGGEYTQAIIDRVRKRNEALQAKRKKLLVAAGYPEDYTDLKYECSRCSDSGYVNNVICECMRRELILAGCDSSGIGQLLRVQKFDNFSLEYYRSTINTYEEMDHVLSTAYRYANNFSAEGTGNLAFIGGTGLGKTHLSSAVAGCVIERGYDVFYVSAQGLISDFERERFGNAEQRSGNETGRYFECDLLIIDDLGTEVTNQFSISCLYNVINTRLNLRRSTIISANLGQQELRNRYSDRIISRILGEYIILRFVGTDVRLQKLGNKNK